MLSPGDHVDRYVIERVLGQGGMGQVFVALDPKLERRVALKVLALPTVAEEGSQPWAQRLVREARAAAAFNHPNVVAIYDVGEHEGQPFIAMELVLGKTLRGFVGKASAAEVPERVGWLVDVARGLAAAHKRGIIHRDIKPDNVMLTSDGVIKIVDFGIARRNAKSDDASQPTAVGETLTQAGGVVGTIRYMAPEQMRGEAIDGRCDQFAWAVMAYELLAGAHPWQGEDQLALAAAMLTKAPEPLRKRSEVVPAQTADVIDRALQSDPNARFITMNELVSALGHESGGAIAAVTRGGGAAPTPRSARRWIIGGGVLAVVAATAAAVIWQSRPPSPGGAGSESGEAAVVAPIEGVINVRIGALGNASGRTEEDWLGVGLAEALRAKLGALPDVRVEVSPGKPSAPTAPNEIAVSGTFERAGENVKVSLSLTRVGAPAEIIERSAAMQDLFKLQDDLAGLVAAKLRGELKEADTLTLQSTGTRNLDAFEAYGKGLAFLNAKRVPDALREFSRAVSLDPTFSSSRAAMIETKARSNHTLVKPDGTVVNTVLFVVPASVEALTWPLSTNMGKVLNAWDLQGKPLKILAEPQPLEHMRYTFTLPPPTPGRERKFVYEYQRPSKIRQKEGLFVYSSAYSTSEGGEQTTIIELPAGSEVLAVTPIPVQLSVDPSATFVMINERRSPFDGYFLSLLYSSTDVAKKGYLEKTPIERLDSLRKLDILPENRAVGERLASMVEPFQTCLHAARGRKAEATAALERLEGIAVSKAMLDAYAPFLLHRARACAARATGDGRTFLREIGAALAEKSRPSELVQDALHELVDAQLELGQPARAFDAVRAELVRAEMREGPFFALPPAPDEKNPAAIVDVANALIVAGDLDAARATLDKIDKKAVTLYWHLARARLAVARYEQKPSDDATSDVRAALLAITAAHPMPWVFADTAFMLAHADRAGEGLDLLLKKAPDRESTPPIFDALRAVIGKLPDPEARLGAILTLLRGAGETEYGSHYRLEMVASAVGATATLPDAKRDAMARALFAEAEKLLSHTGDAACDHACQKESLAGACPALAALEPRQRQLVTRAGACDKR